MLGIRLGDDIDDYCIKCKRITNHAVVSLMNEEAAKVRCRSCYNEHDFRHEQAPPTKKELKRLAMLQAGENAAQDGAAVDSSSQEG
ncbi:MAG: hypothetical protein R2762_23635 [Bryobacteraceae bacterium]